METHGTTRVKLASVDSYGLVLALLIVDYVVLSLSSGQPWAVLVRTVFISATALLTFHVSFVSGRPLLWVRIGVVVALASGIGAAIGPGDRSTGISFLVLSLLVLSCPLAIAWRIVHHTRVSVQTILGAVSVYILIGMVFACADLAYQLLSGRPFFAQSGAHDSADFLYFSFITMTTVGYGDLSPASGLPRTLAVFEALTGQVFLVVMVSRLVALLTPIDRRGGPAGFGRPRGPEVGPAGGHAGAGDNPS